MIAVADLVESLGAGLLRVVVAGHGAGADVHDVVLAEPGDPAGQPGELVLGVGLADPAAAVALLERAASAGAAGVVFRKPLAGAREVTRAARRLAGPALLELQPHSAWAHVIWLLRGVLDRVSAPDSGHLGTPGPHSDLFALADRAAEIVDAPVTVEDAQSRVLAYSARQDVTDSARVSTIVGRRVPPEVIAHFRASGVFRRLARSSDPVLAPAGPDGTLPRLIIPVRAGGEWLGSIWAVVRPPVPPERIRELTDIASVVALHLLRLRAEAGIARRVSAAQLRVALRDGAPDPGSTAPALPPGPWRVVALGARGGNGGEDVRRRLDLWESVARRFGWHQPLLADLDGVLFGLVTDPPQPVRRTGSGPSPGPGSFSPGSGSSHSSGPGPGASAGPGHGRSAPPPAAAAESGSLAWLGQVLAEVRAHDTGLYAAVGGPARTLDQLPRSRGEAVELDGLVTSGRLPLGLVPSPGTPARGDRENGSGMVLLEDAWDAVVVERARIAAGARTGLMGGPLPALLAHDRDHGTAYLTTLAAWLDHFGDPRSAAEELRIHPNTLRYRLRRLNEAVVVDLSSHRVRLALRIQLAALDDPPRAAPGGTDPGGGRAAARPRPSPAGKPGTGAGRAADGVPPAARTGEEGPLACLRPVTPKSRASWVRTRVPGPRTAPGAGRPPLALPRGVPAQGQGRDPGQDRTGVPAQTSAVTAVRRTSSTATSSWLGRETAGVTIRSAMTSRSRRSPLTGPSVTSAVPAHQASCSAMSTTDSP